MSILTKEEIDAWKRHDPIDRFQNLLLEAKIIDDKDIEKIQEDVKQLIDNAVKFAEESPEPDVTEVMGWVYA